MADSFIEVFIPWIGPSLNKVWAGIGWRERKNIADQGHKACLFAKKVRLPWERVSLEFIPHVSQGKLYDCTNYALTAKVLEDGLVSVGVLRGDSVKYVSGVRLSQPVRAKEPGTLVRFREA